MNNRIAITFLGTYFVLFLISLGQAESPSTRIFWSSSGLLFTEYALKNFPKESTWLGVFHENREFISKSVKITIKDAPGTITNPNEGNTMGKRVYLNPEETPIFLLKDVPGMNEGVIKSAKIGIASGKKNKVVPIIFNNEKFRPASLDWASSRHHLAMAPLPFS